MTRRNRIIIFISIIVGLVLAFLLFIAYLQNRGDGFIPALVNRQELAPRQETTAPNPPPPVDRPTPTQPVPAAPAEDPEDGYLRQLARLFVERMGSYSNQSNNEHLSDIMALATPRMQEYLATLGVEQRRDYQGVTTRVIQSSLLTREDTTASVEVRVQQETKSVGNATRLYRTGRVELERDAVGEWKVGGVFWTEE